MLEQLKRIDEDASPRMHFTRFFEIKILRSHVGFEPTQPTKPKEDGRAVSTAIGVGQETTQHLLVLFKKINHPVF